MVIKYTNEFFLDMGLGDTTTCVYQFIFDFFFSNAMKIIQYFNMHGLGLCIKFNNFVAHMFFACSFIHNTAVPIAIRKNTYFRSLKTYTTLFDWGAGN